MSMIEGLRARLAAREAEAKEKALTSEELEISGLVEREREAAEAIAAAEATRRANDLAARLEAAEREAAGRYLCAGVDLVRLFPLGRAPAGEKLPGRGVIIVRDPQPEKYDAFSREVEAKSKTHGAIFADLLCSSVLDPAPDSSEAALLRAFMERYPGAAVGAGDVVAKLGGARVAADKRGRA